MKKAAPKEAVRGTVLCQICGHRAGRHREGALAVVRHVHGSEPVVITPGVSGCRGDGAACNCTKFRPQEAARG